MKKISLLLSLFILPSFLFSQKIAFDTTANWKAIVVQAKEMKRLIYIDFYTSWCGPCKKMDKETFTDPSVYSKFNSTFVNIKINAEKGEGIKLAKKYNIDAYPTSLFINPADESIVYKSVGYLSSKDFLKEADEALIAYVQGPYGDMEIDFQKGRRDLVFLTNYIRKKQMYGHNISREVDAITTTYSLDTLFLKQYNWLTRRLQLDIDSKTFAELANRIDMAKNQELYTINSSINTLVQKTLDVAIEKAKEDKSEAQLNTVLTYFEKTNLYSFKTAEFKIYYKMRFYRHGSDVQKLMDYTNDYVSSYVLPRIDKDLRFDSFSGKMAEETLNDLALKTGQAVSLPKRKLGFATSKNTEALFGSIQSYIDFVSDTKALASAEKWAQKLIELDDSKENLNLYATLLRKTGKTQEAIAIEMKVKNKVE
jgi:thiol-disulfide isomerase/thioredoxin